MMDKAVYFGVYKFWMFWNFRDFDFEVTQVTMLPVVRTADIECLCKYKLCKLRLTYGIFFPIIIGGLFSFSVTQVRCALGPRSPTSQKECVR